MHEGARPARGTSGRSRTTAEAPARSTLGRAFHDTLGTYLGGLSPNLRRFWLLVPVTGVLAGLAAVASVHFLQLVQWLGWGAPENLLEAARRASLTRRLLSPLFGGVLVVLTERLFHRLPEGHGTSRIIEAIWVRRGRVQLRWAFLHGIVSLVVVGLGASLGREGALVYFGAAIASWLARLFQLERDQHKLLVACGASAGMAAVYNTPLGGAMFGLEIFLGGLALDLYGPLIFASILATIVSRTLLFEHPSYVIPHYRLDHAAELPLYLMLGLFLGVLSALLVSTVELLNRLRNSVPTWLKRYLPLLAMAIVAGIGLVFPHLLGNGYDTVNLALQGALPFYLLLLLPPLKLLLSALCGSAGVPGGFFTPSLFIGGLAGGAFGVLGHRLFPGLVMSSGGYVVVGMAAILAGSTHATLAAALLLFEMTGNYDLILPILGACVVAAAVSRAINRESVYTAPLKRRGLELPRIARPAWMQREGVRSLVRKQLAEVPPEAKLDEVLLRMARLPDGDPLFVVDPSGHLMGAIAPATVREVLLERAALPILVAADLIEPTESLSVDSSLWEATRRALAAQQSAFPVIAPREGNRVVGTLPVADILAAAAKPSR